MATAIGGGGKCHATDRQTMRSSFDNDDETLKKLIGKFADKKIMFTFAVPSLNN